MNEIDEIFYVNISYNNSKEYIKNNIDRNLSLHELKKCNILDYGCGTGDASFYFAENSAEHITAIDIGKANIELAESKKILSPIHSAPCSFI